MRNTLLALTFGFLVAGSAQAGGHMKFQAQLEPFDLTGKPVLTTAQGMARVEVIDDGSALAFRVNVAGIENLLMAHIHVATDPVSVTDPAGPVAFWFTGGPPPGTNLTERVDGTLAEGYIITDGQLQVWDPTDPDAGTVAGLIGAILEGRASVVVHTDDLNPDTPSGVAGDSRAGELRGTLR
ncbi:MAG: CHRD domain-containing protein [Candidatus Competibacterales bacterium]|nr:CHRD domain-containing protein [Candidatus Competibacterales bacterium]